jgi:hypothetical protein
MMSKFYNPRDYDTIGFGNNRQHILISDEEKRKRAKLRKNKKQNVKNKGHLNKHWDEDLWD